MTTPTIEPQVIAAGDTITWQRSLPDYPAPTWTLKYALRGAGVINIVSAASGTNHLITETADTSAAWLPGIYTWQGYVENSSGERHTVAVGTMQITRDLTVITEAYDGRSHARKVLEAIEAVLEGRATTDQEEISHDGLELKKTPISDLIILREKYRREVQSEETAERIRQGLASGRKILVRF